MRVSEVDERDSSWEDHAPVFRVYVFRGGERAHHSWATSTYDVEDADLLDVATWAQQQVGNSGLYAIALVRRESGIDTGTAEKGLVWLIGNDANDELVSPRAVAAHARMTRLRGKRMTFVDP